MFDTIISVEDLHRHLPDSDWQVVDCRFQLDDTEAGRRAYQAGHIPGALYAHLDDDLSGPIIPQQTGRHPLPSVAEAAALFSRLGIDEQVQVVVYDDKGGAIAARLWWMLRWLGHEAAAVLDGGLSAWTTQGLPLENAVPEVQPRTFVARERSDWVLDADEVDAIRQKDDWALIDSRTPERYRGEHEPIDPVAGHIPGAQNAPHPETVGPQGTYRTANELRAHFQKIAGERPAERTAFYCGSGVTACRNILAYKAAGLGDARLYAGSWSEWIWTEKERSSEG